jgi:glycosyltransferase involved in cell wall biosynthesis
MTRICLLPHVHGVGGMVSFQGKLTEGLARRGIQVCRDPQDTPYEAILITGGTRSLGALRRARRRGVPIVQRLDGVNWLHRRLPTGPRHYLRAEYGNRLLALLRRYFVSHVVYQSEFVRGWWQRAFGAEAVPASVIRNGVDLQSYTPQGPGDRPTDRRRLLLVEGSLQGGYETGLMTAVGLAGRLAGTGPVELTVAGRVSPDLQAAAQAKSQVPIRWAGLVAPGAIPQLDRSAHLLFSADVNAACPNSVIEALACGLPVAAFATGALPELVTGDSGRLAPYGGDPWKLEPPDLDALAAAAAEILADQARFRRAARCRAEEAFGLDAMVDKYLEVLVG